MDFVEAFDGPTIENIGGVDISFPPLLIDDYTKWTEELRIAEQANARKFIPKTLDPTARIIAEQRIGKIQAPGLDVIAELIWTIPGAIRVLSMSLGKSGVTVESQKQIIERLRPQRLHALAAEVSRLFERRPTAAPLPVTEEGRDPNSPLPVEESEAAGAATGSQIAV